MKDEESRRCRRSRMRIRTQWWWHVAAQASSGLTAAAYCKAHGLPPKSFYRWNRVLRESGELEALLRGMRIQPHCRRVRARRCSRRCM